MQPISSEDKEQLIELFNHQYKSLKRYFIDNAHINNLPKEVSFLAKIQLEDIRFRLDFLDHFPDSEINIYPVITAINILLIERDIHIGDRNHLELYSKMVQLDKIMEGISRRLDRVEQSIKPKPEDKWIRTVKTDV